LTDLSYIQFMGPEGVACLDVGFPMRYSHSALEVVDLGDLAGLVTLLDAALSRVTPGFDLSRGVR
jgi:putative aminopeptidase FrvX